MAHLLEFVSTPDMVLETDAGEVRTRVLDGPDERSEFRLPEIPELAAPAIDLGPGESSVFFATVAVPHLVLVVENVSSVDLERRGRELRYHPAVSPLGSNVNFVSCSGSGWVMRTYERGVEAETLACGTGAVASAAVLSRLGLIRQLPWEVQTASGMVLAVNGRIKDGRLEESSLIGESRLVYRAVLGN
jgi:diaminopimelate epimerase